MSDTADARRSSHTSRARAGWRCAEIGTFARLVPSGRPPFSWLNPAPLIKSRNDWVARRLRDPTNDERRRWLAAGPAKDPLVEVTRNEGRTTTSFLVIGDCGEGDESQYAVVPALLGNADTDFLFICSDVVYPSGDATDYDDRIVRPYREYPNPIYAIPGNHDWYDGLNGFMGYFCGVDGRDRPPRRREGGAGLRVLLRGLLWRDRPGSHPLRRAGVRQPGPYFSLDAGPVVLVGIDTGITGTIDREQGAWLLETSRASTKPKILLTGKPLYVDGRHHPGAIEGGGTIDDIVTAPEHNYVAAIGGDVHNYQRYPIRSAGSRTIQYIVSGGGGGYMHGTHKIPRVDLPGVAEDDFRCYPMRGDSLSIFSRNLDRRFCFGRGWLEITPEQAAQLIGERLGTIPNRPGDKDTTISWRARLAFSIVYPQRYRFGGLLHQNYSEFLDWNDPPLFKSFLRVDATEDAIRIRCFGATGCLEDEKHPPLEDEVIAARDGGTWHWRERRRW
jgi:Calcineurin-like phosphoesterase